VCERVADPADQARAEWFLAYAETDFGDVPAVDERLERALKVFRDTDDRWGTAAVLNTRAKLGYLRAHPCYKRPGPASSDPQSRRNFVLHHRGDPNQEIHLALVPLVIRQPAR
jgi:hypothetical protein